jgi:hypothetical protein
LHYAVNMEVDEVQGEYFFLQCCRYCILHVLDLCCIFK